MTVDVRYYLDASAKILDLDPLSGWEYPVLSLGPTVAPLLLGLTDPSSYLVGFACLCVLLDFGVLSVLRSQRFAERGQWLWIAGVPLLGLVSITRIDMAACCAAAFGLRAIASRRPRAAGGWIALGAAIKVWPAVAFLTMRTLQDRRTALAGAGVLTFSAAASVLLLDGLGLGFLTHQAARGVQIESLPALPLLWAEQLGLADYETRFAYGAQQIYGPGVGAIAASSTIAGLVGLLGCAVMGQRRARELPDQLLVAVVALLLLVLTNKVLSPQYLLWVLLLCAFLGALAPKVRVPVFALLAAVVLTHAVFPYLYPALLRLELLPVVLLTARDGLLVAVLVLLARQLRSEGHR